MSSLLIKIPARMSQAANKNFPNDLWTHSLGARSMASRGVYRYVSRVYGLFSVSSVQESWCDIGEDERRS